MEKSLVDVSSCSERKKLGVYEDGSLRIMPPGSISLLLERPSIHGTLGLGILFVICFTERMERLSISSHQDPLGTAGRVRVRLGNGQSGGRTREHLPTG